MQKKISILILSCDAFVCP